MKKQNDGGPAYPLSLTTTGGDNDNVMDNIDYSPVGAGMSKREVYAKDLFAADIINRGYHVRINDQAQQAVEAADALIEALKK